MAGRSGLLGQIFRREDDDARGRRSEQKVRPAETPIKSPPMEIDGRVMTAEEFVAYIESLEFPEPLPTRVFLHHTWKPTRETWDGRNTILGMKRYYEQQLWRDSQGRLHEGWTAGPHLFVADDGIWLFSDVRYDGVGVYGHNYRTRHLEMVGNYDDQLPGGPTLHNTIVALGILHEKLGLDVRQLGFHRDFSTKTCPGRAVQKTWIVPQVEQWLAGYREAKREQEEEQKLAALRRTLTDLVQDMLVPSNPKTALTLAGEKRGLLGALTNEVPIEIDDRGYIVQIFAEALLVPVHRWDQVQSLGEYEKEQEEGDRPEPGEGKRPDEGQPPADGKAPEGDGNEGQPSAGARHLNAPPTGPYPFTGKVR